MIVMYSIDTLELTNSLRGLLLRGYNYSCRKKVSRPVRAPALSTKYYHRRWQARLGRAARSGASTNAEVLVKERYQSDQVQPILV